MHRTKEMKDYSSMALSVFWDAIQCHDLGQDDENADGSLPYGSNAGSPFQGSISVRNSNQGPITQEHGDLIKVENVNDNT